MAIYNMEFSTPPTAASAPPPTQRPPPSATTRARTEKQPSTAQRAVIYRFVRGVAFVWWKHKENH